MQSDNIIVPAQTGTYNLPINVHAAVTLLDSVKVELFLTDVLSLLVM